MKKHIVASIFLSLISLYAQDYSSTGTGTAESKKEACQTALENAKMDAIEQAGTMVLSKYNSDVSEVNGEVKKSVQQQLSTAAVGVVKLQSKSEDIKILEGYQFTCKVTASFSIDKDEMNKVFEHAMEKKKISGYYEAEGYSEEGQSRYKAFTAATMIAQRNLLEQIKKAEITSLTKLENGKMEDKMAKFLRGSIEGVEVVKKEYDSKDRFAHVVLRLSKERFEAFLNN